MKTIAKALILCGFLAMAGLQANAQTAAPQMIGYANSYMSMPAAEAAQTVAQAPQTAAPTQIAHFTLSGSAVAFRGTGGTVPASIAQASFALTPRVAIGYKQASIPQLATFSLGVADYTLPLNTLVGKKVASHFVFDSSQVKVTFEAGVGAVLQANQNVKRVAETVGISLSYPLSDHVSVLVIGGNWLHGGIQNGFIVTPSTAAISSGLSISF